MFRFWSRRFGHCCCARSRYQRAGRSPAVPRKKRFCNRSHSPPSPSLFRRSYSMLIGRSPVRISFGGGGTDLPSYYEQFGGLVLSTAINKYFYTILGNRSDGRIQVISSDLRLFGNWSDLAALPALPAQSSGLEIPLAVLKDLGADLAADLFLASEIPPGTGLGSSASVCVNLLKVLTTHLRCSLSKYELA